MLALASRRANSVLINTRAATATGRMPLTLLPSAQSGNSWNFVRRWVATLVLDVVALALHSWLHVLQCMHTCNAAQHRVIACACRSHQKVTPQQTNFIVKSSTPTITLGIHCWMHRTQRQHPYGCSGGGASLAMAGYSPSSTSRCCGNKRESSTQQGMTTVHAVVTAVSADTASGKQMASAACWSSWCCTLCYLCWCWT